MELGLSNGITAGRFGSSLGGGVGDTTGPAVAITSATSSPTSTNPISVTITFTNPETGQPEAVTGFAVGDITISAGGSLASFTEASNGVYTVAWTLASGVNTMDVAGGVCTDSTGNGNTAALQFSMTYSSLLNGLVASWKLDEASGNGLDATGRGNTLSSIYGAPVGVAGKIGNARQFASATPDALAIATNDDVSLNPGDYSIAFWMNPTTVATCYLVDKSNGTLGEFSVFVITNKVNFSVRDATGLVQNLQHATTLTTSTWFFVCARHDSVSKKVHISINNSDTAAGSAYAGTPADSAHALTLAARADNRNNPYNGLLDEVQIWNRYLTDEEVTELYG